MPLFSSIEERFMSHVEKTDTCWIWKASCISTGLPYGLFRWSKTRYGTAHRYSHELFIGPIPKGLCVLHRCDNPRCVNPQHLWLGTYTDNNRDAVAKGRSRGCIRRGSANPSALLDDATVMAIRREYAADRSLSQATLGKKYGITQTHVGDIIRGKIWTHLPTIPVDSLAKRKRSYRDGHDAATCMIAAGHAREWDGQGPKP